MSCNVESYGQCLYLSLSTLIGASGHGSCTACTVSDSESRPSFSSVVLCKLCCRVHQQQRRRICSFCSSAVLLPCQLEPRAWFVLLFRYVSASVVQMCCSARSGLDPSLPEARMRYHDTTGKWWEIDKISISRCELVLSL